jgi:phosphate transport system ATP-binding protein
MNNNLLPIVTIEKVNVWYGHKQALFDISISINRNTITAIMGPSGCGKSTFVRVVNRTLELIPDVRISGRVFLEGENILDRSVDPIIVRRKIGMVFQRPIVFPHLSIYENVAIGVKLNKIVDKKEMPSWVEECLKKAHLWDEVKDDLKKSATKLSGGQQQRLCIARALAMKPILLLLDEPCSAIDPIGTAKIEETLLSLSETLSIVIVTHNLQQAARISSYCAFMYLGKLIEYDKTATIFTVPKNKLTEDFVSGAIS